CLDLLLAHHGYEVECITDPIRALRIVREGGAQIVICDRLMPQMDGLDFCRSMRAERLSGYVYCIMISGFADQENRLDALAAGADDFIAKPFDARELLHRVRVGARLMSMSLHEITVFALAKLAESRDPETGAHLERVRNYCQLLAEELSRLEQYRKVIDHKFVELIFQTSPLHDIGKVGIPDAVLLKPGKLTPEEFEVMKKHTIIGEQTLQAAVDRFPGAEFLEMARDIAAAHHERFDGKGYPRQLAAEKIPLAARIVAVADVYDAMTSKRVYKEAQDHQEVAAIIQQGRGTQFDPDVVDAFNRLSGEFLAISQRYREPLAKAA
ncbi:MAG TPA: HD domain-containing phosphohydrolase, partial [Tepidisphaeraceae bacterium]|nr:HD domain-containing phosphohydrolase [Tepidisphaeraceae bacterium]